MIGRSIHTFITRLGLVVCLALGFGALRGAGAADTAVYGDALAPDWVNWSWGGTLNLSATAPLHGGSRALSVKSPSRVCRISR